MKGVSTMPFGSEIALTPGLANLEKFYIRIFGAPILGLRVRARTILSFLDRVGLPRRIVDAGSGRGMITLACARRFPSAVVIGVDLDERQNCDNNEITAKLGLSKNLSFLTWDVMKLQDLGKFDLIISTDMLEHLEDDLGGVRMFHDALESGGYLLVHVPHLTRKTFGWKRENWMDVEGHMRPGYTKDGLMELLTKGRFKVRDCIFNYNSYETLANDISKVITGAKQANKGLYAVAFPFLMMIVFLGSLYRPRHDGSGLVALARRED
jgi:cyclopropane fatty-acyl-phospholipid synthase-like methyltransferase